ncbi:hypothetical protein RIF29_20680 [Crotalaria pallida]|uniref:Protein FAR1-RELATED SEQUENCE n=1 Tax=Crotalaria pallida TaxID=3830 RepID=A0AAN9I5A3_CROPI
MRSFLNLIFSDLILSWQLHLLPTSPYRRLQICLLPFQICDTFSANSSHRASIVFLSDNSPHCRLQSRSNIVANTSETDFVDVAAKEVEADMEFDQDVTMNEKDQYRIDGMDDIGMSKCCCQRLESQGIPCAHIFAVLFFLDIGELPKCVIMPRWTKFAKQGHKLAAVEQGNWIGDNLIYSHLGGLMSCYRHLCNLASRNAEDYKSVREKVCNEIMLLEGKSHEHDDGGSSSQANQSGIMDPIPMKRKGGGASSSAPSKEKRVRTTSVFSNE